MHFTPKILNEALRAYVQTFACPDDLARYIAELDLNEYAERLDFEVRAVVETADNHLWECPGGVRWTEAFKREFRELLVRKHPWLDDDSVVRVLQHSSWYCWHEGLNASLPQWPISRSLSIESFFAQPDNTGVLLFLNLAGPNDVWRFESSAEGHPLNEGGWDFFHRYGSLIPATARCEVNLVYLFVHERTARIFALQKGRSTIALRPDFSRTGIDDCFAQPLKGETLDGPVDLTELGPSWVLFSADGEDEAQRAFFEAYEHAGA